LKVFCRVPLGLPKIKKVQKMDSMPPYMITGTNYDILNGFSYQAIRSVKSGGTWY
jgi:hypothetical protein